MENTYQLLTAPFPSKDIEWRVGNVNRQKMEGLALPYVTNRAIMERLDNVFGPLNWQNSFTQWRDNSQLCGISIRDSDSGEWVTKYDGADNTAVEGTKGGLSDSMKRAAVQWGIGRYLYNLPTVWARVEPRGKSFAFANGTKFWLPAWAIPGDEISDQTPQDKILVTYAGNQAQQRPQQNAQNYSQRGAQNNAQQRPQNNAQQRPQQGAQQPPRMTRRDYDTIMNKAKEAGISRDDVFGWVRKKYGLTNIYELNIHQFKELIAALEAQVQQPTEEENYDDLPWEQQGAY